MMRTRGFLHKLNSDRRGAAAAEMAMVLPLLLLLMFGSFEAGRFFLDEHVVLKAVRDGARYASRQNFSNYTCPSTVNAAAEASIRNVVRYGKQTVALGDQPRLPYWGATNSGGAQTVTVTLTCPTTLDGTAETNKGIYQTRADMPRVTVHATVQYNPLFGLLNLGSGSFNLTAESQSAVMGL